MARVMISIPDDFLRQVDEVAKSRHQSRSEYFRELARRDMERRERDMAGARRGSIEAAAQAWERIQEFAERMRGSSWNPVGDIGKRRDAGLSTKPVEQVHDAPGEDE
jgi:predicted transcriptional regulator